MSSDAGASVADEWMQIARKDWRRAERNLKDRDAEAAGFFLQQCLENRPFSSSTTGSFERFMSLMLCWTRLPNSSRT